MSDYRRTAQASQAMNHYYNGSLSETKVEAVSTPCNLYGFEIENNSAASDIFVQIFDKLAANVTVGTTVPDYTFRVPAGANFGKDPQSFPLRNHTIGVTIACTATRTGAGAPAANCSINLWSWDQH
jgi:hypothetical protein